MSKELKKFQERHKKIAPKLKQYTKKNAEAFKKEIYRKFLDARSDGEAMITESLADARDNGVTGNKFSDFMKDKGFQDAVKVFNKAVAQIEEPQKQLASLTAEASKAADELAALHKDIEKDLKKRKDKSESKSDIENLKAQIEKEWSEVSAATKVEATVPKAQAEYVGNFQKTVDKLLKMAPDEAAAKRDKVMLPQMLVDRNRAKARNSSIQAAKQIGALCDEALKKAESSSKEAQPALKKAAALLAGLKKTNADYDKALKYTAKSEDFKKSKDKQKIEADVETIGKAYTQAERKLRGVATTIKKAG